MLPLVLGCGDDPKITEIRERDATTDFQPRGTAERFGMMRGGPGGNPHAGGFGSDAPSAAPQFAWTTPEGWEEKVPPGTMRVADFRLSKNPEVECYLSVVQGGIAANVMRWRKQMGLEPVPPSAIAGLPQQPFLGQRGIFVDLEGTFAGMGQSAPREGYRLLGLLVEEPGRTVTLKMTGPKDAVAGERDRFLELAQSFRAAEPAAAPDDSGGEGSLAWDAPKEWERRPDQQMRVVTFAPRGATGTECYITILGGSGGGVEANLNRWRQQMGQTPLDAAGFAALESIQVLGRDAKVLEVSGDYTDMQGNQVGSASLLGVVCPVEGALLTVKMTGPKDVIENEKDRFLAFCRSLRLP
ncbi:MAG TPA: hypothetical protein VFY93_08550 [Planctomycetota bacterium]|nr:hypothetical protein [Planctomycetota bacterium]